MENVINVAKQIIDEQVQMGFVNQSSEFLCANKTYPWTNENIEGYLKLVDFSKTKKALTVLASGDQPFNLIKHGVKDIDTFDINPLAEYYALGLKRALILRYDYHSFNNIIRLLYNPWGGTNMIHTIIRNLFPYMEDNHKKFWETILEYDYKIQKGNDIGLNVVLMLVVDVFNMNQLGLYNYLNNENDYNLIRNSLASANISFKNINILDVPTVYQNHKYDVIMLSNIMDYLHLYLGENWDYHDFCEIKENIENLGEKDAYIFLHYIIGYLRNGKMNRESIINKSIVSKKDFSREELRIIPGNAFLDNGIILSRVK